MNNSLNKKKAFFIFCSLFISILLSSSYGVFAQGGFSISPSGANPHPSAILDVSSTSKGALIPRMATVQRDLIASPAQGLLIFNTDCNLFNYWNGGAWIAIGNNSNISTPGIITGNTAPCYNSTGITYSISPVSNATSYNWTVPSGGIIVSGQGTKSITVNFASTNGDVCVAASNPCGVGSPACLPITLVSSVTTLTATVATNVASTSFSANWLASAGANTYYLDVSKDSTFASFVTGYNNLNVGNVTTYSVTGLTCMTTYYYRVRVGNNCSISSGSNTITVGPANCSVTMQWTDPVTGSCDAQIYQTIQTIANAMPAGTFNVRITAHQVNPIAGYGDWTGTFLNSGCVKQWLNAWALRDVNTYNNWNPAVCQATDTTGTSYFFVVKNDGGNSPQIAIYPTSGSPAQYMKVYLLDRSGAWCDLAGVNNRPGYDAQVTNGNTNGTAGDYLRFTWW